MAIVPYHNKIVVSVPNDIFDFSGPVRFSKPGKPQITALADLLETKMVSADEKLEKVMNTLKRSPQVLVEVRKELQSRELAAKREAERKRKAEEADRLRAEAEQDAASYVQRRRRRGAAVRALEQATPSDVDKIVATLRARGHPVGPLAPPPAVPPAAVPSGRQVVD